MKLKLFDGFALSYAIRLALRLVVSVIPASAGVAEFGTVSGLECVRCSVQKNPHQKRGTMARLKGAG